jgi:hypothetical protein
MKNRFKFSIFYVKRAPKIGGNELECTEIENCRFTFFKKEKKMP